MQFLQVEGDKLINLDLIDEVELKHHHKKASLWSGGTVRIADSEIAYTYLVQHRGEFLQHEQVPCEKCNVKVNTLADLQKHQCVPVEPPKAE